MMRAWLLAVTVFSAGMISGCCSMCPKGGACAAPAPGSIRHVVLFKWKDGTPPETVKAIENSFRALPSKVDGISGFEWGTDVSPEKLSQGFTHCFLVTFPDTAARDAYLPHPEHKAFVDLMKPHLDKVLVVDYVARD